MNSTANQPLNQAELQGLFYDHLVRQQFTWFSAVQQGVNPSSLESRLADHLQLAMAQAANNPARLLFVRLTLGEQLPGMIDLIMDHADSHDAMRKTINSDSWLAKELLQWVNAPRFRQRSVCHDFVTSLDQALALFDGKSLGFQLLDFAMAQAASREGRICKLLNRRILEWSQELAQFAHLLAEGRGLCTATASMAGLVQGLAPLAISQNFVYLFEGQLKQALEKAQESGNKKAYDQLNSVRPPIRVLLSHLTQSTSLQHELLNEMGATGQLLAGLTREVDADLPLEQLSHLARLLRQARGYSQYRWLNDACVLTPQQSHELLTGLALNERELADLARLRRR